MAKTPNLIEDDDPLGFDEQEETTAVTRDEEGFPEIEGAEVSSAKLRSFILRVEKLEEEKRSVMEDIKDVYGEAKSMGFDVKIIRKIVSLRKLEVEKRREEDELLDLYKSAIGME